MLSSGHDDPEQQQTAGVALKKTFAVFRQIFMQGDRLVAR